MHDVENKTTISKAKPESLFRRFWTGSLRRQLTTSFLLVAVIPLIVTAAVVSYRSFSTQAPLALETQSQIAKRVAEQVNSFILERELELQILIEAGDLGNLNRAEQTAVLKNLLSTQGVYDELILVDGNGREIIYASRLEVVTSDTFGSRKGKDEYERPKTTGQTYYGPVSFSDVTGQPFQIISVPIYDLNSGKLKYIIIANFRFKTVWDLMAQADVVGNGLVYLVDNSNRVVAHANPSIALQQRAVSLPAENSFTTGLDGGPVAMALETIALNEQAFTVVAEQPRSEALALPTNNALISIVITLGMALLAAFIGVGIANFITNPIGKLSEAAQLLSQGNFSQPVVVERQDEIGNLAKAFNSMAIQLQGTLQGLEQRVAERTKALETSAEVSRRLASILDPNELASAVVNEIRSAYDYYYAQIYLFDDAGENLVLTAGTGEAGAAMMKRGHSLSKGRGLVGRAAETKESILVSDTSQDPNWLPNDLLPDTKAEAAIPIAIGDQVLGVLDVQDDLTNDINPADITLLESLANQVAISLQNARSYVKAETALQEAKSLVDNAPEAILIIDAETGLFSNPNENALKLFGLSREEMAKTGPVQTSPLTQPDGSKSAEKAREKINETIKGGTPIFEWTLLNKQGQDVLCEVRLVRLPGDKPRTRASITDITERKRLQELTAARARQQEAINTITQRIQSATTIEEAMQVAARELGNALGQRQTLVTLEAAT